MNTCLDGYYKNRHSCFLLQYHLVLVTKYHKPVIRGELAKELDRYYWEPYFWSLSYFIGSVSDRTKKTVKNYIQNQKDKD